MGLAQADVGWSFSNQVDIFPGSGWVIFPGLSLGSLNSAFVAPSALCRSTVCCRECDYGFERDIQNAGPRLGLTVTV